MKSKVSLIPLLLTGTFTVALGSWVASLYGVGEVQSLLSAEGLRHEVRTALSQYMSTPELGIFLMMVPGVGLAWGSGWLGALWRGLSGSPSCGGHAVLSRREVRSMHWALSVLLLYAGMVVSAVASPWACLRGVTGSYYPSPFVDGLPLLLTSGLALTGWIYGYTVGRFRRYADVIAALTQPLRRWSAYPVTLFFLERLYAQLSYTRLLEWSGVGQESLTVAFHACAILLFVGILLQKVPHTPSK